MHFLKHVPLKKQNKNQLSEAVDGLVLFSQFLTCHVSFDSKKISFTSSRVSQSSSEHLTMNQYGILSGSFKYLKNVGTLTPAARANDFLEYPFSAILPISLLILILYIITPPFVLSYVLRKFILPLYSLNVNTFGESFEMFYKKNLHNTKKYDIITLNKEGKIQCLFLMS